MAGISVASKTSSSVALYVSSLDTSWTNGTRTVYWYLGRANGGIPTESNYYMKRTATIADRAPSGGEVTFTGLSPSTQYGVYCAIYHGSTLLAELQGYVTTNADEIDTWSIAPINLGTLTSNYYKFLEFNLNEYQVYRYSFTAPYSGTLDIASWESVDVRVYLTTNPSFNEFGGEPYSYDAYDDGTDYYINYHIEKDTTYYVFFRGFNELVTGACEVDFGFVADAGTNISKWSWSASNGSANDTQTYAAYLALLNKEDTRNFSHLVWNDMVDKVWEIIKVKTNWWDSNYASKDNTKMNYSPYELTANMFNSLRNNIELIGNDDSVLGRKTGISKVESYNTTYPVKAEYFLTLANYINDCIDNL